MKSTRYLLLLLLAGCAAVPQKPASAPHKFGAPIGTYPNAAPLSGPEQMIGNQSGSTVTITPAQISTYANANLPGTIASNTTGNAGTATALAATPSLCSTGNAPTGVLPNGNATGCAAIGGSGTVTTTGSPTSGQIAEFSSASSITPATTTGTGPVVQATSPTLVTPVLGTPASGTLTNTTGFPAASLAAGNLPSGVLSSGGSTVVGTTDTESLTNKVITCAANTLTNVPCKVFNIRDYGAKCDASTDDHAAWGSAIAAAVASTASGPGSYASVVAHGCPSYISTTINATGIDSFGVIFDLAGSVILCQTNGTPCIEAMGSRFVAFNDLYIYGMTTNPPSWAVTHGRITSSGGVGDGTQLYFKHPIAQGTFSSGIWYNLGSETVSFDQAQFSNGSVTATYGGLVQDGCNHLNLTPVYATQTIAADTCNSFHDNLFTGGSIQVNSGTVLWLEYTFHHRFLNSYGSNSTTNGTAVLMYEVSNKENVMLDMNMHFETTALKQIFKFSNEATPGVESLTYVDPDPQAQTSIFAVDSGVTFVTLNNVKVDVSNTSVALFDTPADYNINGEAHLNTSGNWTYPYQFTGILNLGGVSSLYAGASGLNLQGSGLGRTTFASANSSGTNYTLTFPALSDTLAVLGTAQTYTANPTFSGSPIFENTGSSGNTVVHMVANATTTSAAFNYDNLSTNKWQQGMNTTGGSFAWFVFDAVASRFVINANSNGALTIMPGSGNTTIGASGSTQTLNGTVDMPNLASSSAAQTGILCWTTSTGNLTVDTTNFNCRGAGLPLSTGVTGQLPATNGGTGENNGSNTLTINTNPATFNSPTDGLIAPLEIQQNVQTANYTLVLTDNGKEIYHNSTSAHTFTIPANSSVAFPVGTCIMFTNEPSGGTLTIAITTDTLYFFTDTGTRTLANFGSAVACKKTATTWYINGYGIS